LSIFDIPFILQAVGIVLSALVVFGVPLTYVQICKKVKKGNKYTYGVWGIIKKKNTCRR